MAPYLEARFHGTDPTNRRLLLVFDFTFSRRKRLGRALRDLRRSLDQQLQPTDRVAVATYGTVSGLNLLVGFTEDQEKIDLALDAVQAMLDAKGKRQCEVLGQFHAARFSDSGGADGSSTYTTLAGELSPTAALAVLSGPVEYDDSEDDGVVVQEKNASLPRRGNRWRSGGERQRLLGCHLEGSAAHRDRLCVDLSTDRRGGGRRGSSTRLRSSSRTHPRG